MGTLNEDLSAIKEVEDKIVANKVARFAYTDEAYTTNDANGVAEYDVSKEQNIPTADASVLKVNETVLSKGYRAQASSVTRMLLNHFFGRMSYNLNKVNDNVSNLISTLIGHRGTANGFATLDENGRIPYSQLPESAMSYKGQWNAETNTPTLADGTGTKGDFYIVSVGGTQNLGSGNIQFSANDRIIYDGSVWARLSAGDVNTVNNISPENGNVALTGENIPVSATNATLLSAPLTTDRYADSSVTTNKLANNAVTNAKIADNAVTTEKIVNKAVTTERIADKAVTNAKIADNAVATEKIVNNAVTNAKIADNAVTNAKIADNAVTNAKIVNNAVTNAKIADNAVTNAKIKDPVSVTKGGTGATDAKNGFMNLANGLTQSQNPQDAEYMIYKRETNWGLYTLSTFWEYIKSKISSVLGLTKDNYGGKASTAVTADYARYMYYQNLDLSALDKTKFYPLVCVAGDFVEVAIRSESGIGTMGYNQNRIHFDISTNGWSDLPPTLNIREYTCYENNEITIGCIGRGNQDGAWAIWLRGGLHYTCFSRDSALSLHTSDYTFGGEIYTVGTNYYGGSNTNVSIMFTPQSTITDGAYSSRAITAPNFIGNLAGNAYTGMVHTCSTAHGTQEKTVSIPGFTLTQGACIRVVFANGNSATRPTLNVNGTGAKEIKTYQSGSLVELLAPNGAVNKGAYEWQNGTQMEFVFDGTYWVAEASTIVNENVVYSQSKASSRVYLNGKKEIWGGYSITKLSGQDRQTMFLNSDLIYDNFEHTTVVTTAYSGEYNNIVINGDLRENPATKKLSIYFVVRSFTTIDINNFIVTAYATGV